MIKHLWAYAVVAPGTDRAAQLRSVADLGLTDLALFVNGLDETQFTVPATRERALAETIAGLHRLKVRVHLVSWLRPTERYMNDAATRLRPLCMTWGASSLQFDVEGPWTNHPALRDSEAVTRAFLARHWTFDAWPCPLGITGIVFFRAPLIPVAERCQYVLPQAYSVARPSALYRPKALQITAHERWKRFDKPIVMGLAAWNLNRPGGMSQHAAMQLALATTEGLGVSEAAYWSLRWITASRERSDFVRQACTKLRAGLPQAAPSPPAAPTPEIAWA